MSKKLMFIMSDSEEYLRDEVIKRSKAWGFNSSNVKTIQKWNPAEVRSSISLFEETSIIHLELNDKKDLKSFADKISDKKEKKIFESEKWFGPALIITSIHAQGAKKIENLVKKSGGEVEKKIKPDKMIKVILSRLNINKELESFLTSYAGDDYQILIGIANQIEEMDKEKQNKLEIEDLITRLPSKPGSLPPWEFINPMLQGNANKAIELYERAVEGSFVLVTMILARKKLQLMYRLRILQSQGINDNNKQAKILGERGGPNIWITAKAAKKLSVETTEYLAKLSMVTEANLKGYLNVDSDIVFKNYIALACIAIKYNRPLPLKIK